MLRHRLLIALLALCLSSAPVSVQAQGTAADYERSSKLSDLTRKKVFKDRVTPHWLVDNRRFWYRNDLPGEAREFIFVDAVKGERRLAFDHTALATVLSKATGEKHRGTQLSIEDLDFSEDNSQLRFRADEMRWKWDLKNNTLAKDDAPERSTQKKDRETPPRRQRGDRPRADSPDGKWTVFIKDHNLHLRNRETGSESILSWNGNADDSYSERVFWSPDS